MKLNTILLIALIFSACANHEKKEWTELADFHKVMAAVYHPLKDSGNLTPARKMMKELATSADKLASSSLPSSADKARIEPILDKLKIDSKSLSDEIDHGASDEVIKEKLTSLHKQFHVVMEAAERNHESDQKEEDD